jgi:ribonuclease HI
MKLITLSLSCGSEQEANKIADVLLEKRLAVCVKQINAKSRYLWQNKLENADEVLMLIESVEENFGAIEREVAKHHSYETFTLMSYDVINASKGMESWVEMEIKIGENVKQERVKLYTDGGSRGNPGPSASAFVICNMDNNVVEKSGYYLGVTTNNQAEYQALLRGLQRLGEIGTEEVDIYMDSELIVNQILGKYKIKNPELKPYFDEIKELLNSFKNYSITHVPRAMNAEADQEVNRILDEEKN